MKQVQRVFWHTSIGIIPPTLIAHFVAVAVLLAVVIAWLLPRFSLLTVQEINVPTSLATTATSLETTSAITGEV